MPARYSTAYQPQISIRRPDFYTGRAAAITTWRSIICRRPTILALLVATAILIGIWNRNTIPFIRKSKTFVDPHPLHADLNLTMSHIVHSPQILRVTVTNLHPASSLTLLSWGTPLDPDGLESGVFHITERRSATRILNVVSRTRHSLPPKRDAFIELEPQHAVTKDITLEGPKFSFEKGKEYNIQARGYWKVVWHASVAHAGEKALKLSAGATGIMSWEYESDVVTIKIGR